MMEKIRRGIFMAAIVASQYFLKSLFYVWGTPLQMPGFQIGFVSDTKLLT